MFRAKDTMPLSKPSAYLVRMAVFLVLGAFIAFILYRQIMVAFMANPGLNALIVGVMLIGILLAFRQVLRLLEFGREREGIDLSKLPPFEVLAKYIVSGAGYTVPDKKGSKSVSFSLKKGD